MEQTITANSPSRQEILLRAVNLSKAYTGRVEEVVVFRELNFQALRGEMIAIVGASGTGKSTLLHLLGGLDRPSSGNITIGEFDLSKNAELDLARFRNWQVGFVFQFHHLLPEFSAIENVMMPLLISGQKKTSAELRASNLLHRVGLAGRELHRPGELSGGECQRVALARALVCSPLLLLADEPTGNLDEQTGESIHILLRQLQTEEQLTTIIVTHNQRLASICDRVLRLENGKLTESRADNLSAG